MVKVYALRPSTRSTRHKARRFLKQKPQFRMDRKLPGAVFKANSGLCFYIADSRLKNAGLGLYSVQTHAKHTALCEMRIRLVPTVPETMHKDYVALTTSKVRTIIVLLVQYVCLVCPSLQRVHVCILSVRGVLEANGRKTWILGEWVRGWGQTQC